MSTTFVTTEPIARPENANLCLLLGKAFSSPQHFEPRFPESCRAAVAHLPKDLADAGLALAQQWEDALGDPETTLLAYSRLFVGPFEIQVSPYASHYLEPDGRLMGDVSMWVAECYADSDLGPTDGPSEAPDHISLEWEYLYYLGYQAATRNEPEWIARSRSFLGQHMIKWVPRMAEAILAAETHAFYHALARFAAPFIEFIESGKGAEAE